MMATPPTSPRAHATALIRPALIAGALLLLGIASFAQDPTPKKSPSPETTQFEPFCILPESYEMNPEIFVPIAGTISGRPVWLGFARF